MVWIIFSPDLHLVYSCFFFLPNFYTNKRVDVCWYLSGVLLTVYVAVCYALIWHVMGKYRWLQRLWHGILTASSSEDDCLLLCKPSLCFFLIYFLYLCPSALLYVSFLLLNPSTVSLPASTIFSYIHSTIKGYNKEPYPKSK